MSAEVELFKTEDYDHIGSIPLGPLLLTVFEPLVGRALASCRVQLTFHAVPDDSDVPGTPAIVNLKSSHGFVSVRITENGHVIYQHPHSVREVVGDPLRTVLAEHDPQARHWGFGVKGPGLEQVALVRPVPASDRQITIASAANQPRRFHVEPIADPEPPTISLAELGVDGELRADDRVGVVVDKEIYDDLMSRTPFSENVEEGGFLGGQVYRAHGRPDCYVVEIASAIRAERTGASFLRFTFTGDSFLRVGRWFDENAQDQKLVGWYHTHLFPATDELGLSTIDDALHTTTFRQPWQVAGLLNIAGNSRVLRFYRADQEQMVAAPYWVSSS